MDTHISRIFKLLLVTVIVFRINGNKTNIDMKLFFIIRQCKIYNKFTSAGLNII